MRLGQPPGAQAVALARRVRLREDAQVQIVVTHHVGAAMGADQTAGRAERARALQAERLQPRYGEIADGWARGGTEILHGVQRSSRGGISHDEASATSQHNQADHSTWLTKCAPRATCSQP